jgi:hypothetical protein
LTNKDNNATIFKNKGVLSMTKDEYISVIDSFRNRIYLLYNKHEIYKELCNLCANGKLYEPVLKEHSGFWELMIDSLKRSLASELALLFDAHSDCIALRKLINILEQNKDWVSEYCAIQDCKHLEIIVELNSIYSSCTQCRKNLITYRDKVLSHIDRKNIIETTRFDLTWGDVEDLIDVATQILECIAASLQMPFAIYPRDSGSDTRKLIKRTYRGMKTKPLNNI